MNVCKKCNGTCYVHEECGTCGRDGWVEDEEDGGTMTCPDCDGEAGEMCLTCQGTGEDFDDA